MKLSELKTASQAVAENYRDDPEFRAEWDRTASRRSDPPAAAVALVRRLDINATLRAAGRPVTEVDLDHTAELFDELDADRTVSFDSEVAMDEYLSNIPLPKGG